MRANVFEIKRFAVHDGDGIRTTVFLKGCPLRCVWCHNPESISPAPELAYYAHKCIGCGECVAACPVGAHRIEGGNHVYDRERCIACGACAEVCLGNALTLYGNPMSVDELMPILLEDKDFYDNSGGGVTLSGGECLMHADFCRELLARLKECGVNTAVDTCGFVTRDALDKVMPFTDVFLYDMKAVDSDIHAKCTGQPNGRILENLGYLASKGAAIEVRIPFVPDYNDGEIRKMAEILSKIDTLTKVRVLPYHNYAGSKYSSLGMKNTSPERLPTDAELGAAKEILREYGINVYN